MPAPQDAFARLELPKMVELCYNDSTMEGKYPFTLSAIGGGQGGYPPTMSLSKSDVCYNCGAVGARPPEGAQVIGPPPCLHPVHGASIHKETCPTRVRSDGAQLRRQQDFARQGERERRQQQGAAKLALVLPRRRYANRVVEWAVVGMDDPDANVPKMPEGFRCKPCSDWINGSDKGAFKGAFEWHRPGCKSLPCAASIEGYRAAQVADPGCHDVHLDAAYGQLADELGVLKYTVEPAAANGAAAASQTT